jgi:hypothetical protein
MPATIFAAMVTLGLACSKEEPSKVAVRHPTEQGPKAAANPSASAPPSGSAVPYLPPQASIAERFALEAKQRPSGGARADDLYAALERNGMKLVERRQYLASVYRARYCAQAEVEGKLALGVCEYGSEAEAAEGRKATEQAFGKVPTFRVVANKASTLSIRELAPSPESAEAAKTATTAFMGL